MKILIGIASQSQGHYPKINFNDLEKKYLWTAADLTKDYLFQASINVFDIFMISAEKLPFFSAKRNIELFRKKFFNPPLLVVDASYNSSQRAALLRVGADDCLSPHVNSQEIMAKIEVFNRRPIRSHPNLIKHRGFSFDIQTKTLSWKNEGEITPISIGTNDTYLIEFFFKNKKRIISKFQILDKISNTTSNNPMNLAEVHICALRKKIKKQTGLEIIETVRNAGYRMR